MQEASRVLKNRGLLILSIPTGYYDEDGSVIKGLFFEGEVDEDLPSRVWGLVEDILENLGFEVLEVRSAELEKFLVAQKV